MRSMFKKLSLAALAAVLAAAGAPPARAQEMTSSNFRVPSSMQQEGRIIGGQNLYQNRQDNEMAGRAAMYNRFRVPPNYGSCYSTNPYGSCSAPGGGYLSGAADVINSQGQVAVSVEQARQMHEQLQQMKIDTKRKAFDEYLYERKMRPTEEDERERARIEALRRARNGPPPNEIWSGGALNTLLLGIQRMTDQGVLGPDVPLDPTTLRNINVSSGSSVGSLGLLRNGGKLQWPLGLGSSAFAAERKKMDTLASQAYSQAQSGQVNDDTLQSLISGVDKLQQQLLNRVDVMEANEYMRGKRFLNEFEKTLTALQDPNVSKFATGQWSARGNNVYELAMNMTRDGLKFAPAVQGQQPYYTALYSAMVACYQMPNPSRPWDTMAK